VNVSREQGPQLGLFERVAPTQIRRPAPPAAASDPVTSHIAAAEVTFSGRRDSKKRDILAWLRSQNAPVISMELARAAGMDFVARRNGLVEARCAIAE
jgi:hypothetical protein